MDSTLSKEVKKIVAAANKPSADNAGGFRRLAFTKPENGSRNEKKQQVNPALRLPAGRYVAYKY
jgi:hypothetical protein